MAEQVKIGKLITGDEKRDAIHVAIAPVIAGYRLEPGTDVGFVAPDTVSAEAETKIGIIDPFLRFGVNKGEKCWLFLYPNTITSLRHDWTHPAFGMEFPAPGSKEESERWLMNYAVRANCYDTPAEAFRRLIECLKSGELYFYGSDLHGLYELDDADELKRHAENYLGITINWGHFSFSCSC